MGIISTMVIICLLVWYVGAPSISGFIISTAICCTVTFITVFCSYLYYIYLKQLSVEIKQDAKAIELYAEKANKEFERAGKTAVALTDIKYNNYQTKMAEMILSLAYTVNRYNGVLISKRELSSNWIFSWLIIAPDDNMKIIDMPTTE
jgi:hypothetical protein